MAVTDAYTDAATYRGRIDKSDTGEDVEILADLTSISRLIDKELGRHFTKDAGDVARDFVPTVTGELLYIDDLSAAPTTVLVDENDDGTPETSYAVTDYQLQPLNATTGSESRPYTRIVIPSWSTRAWWTEGRLVRITGRWGWPAVPEPIKSATIELTAILRLETPRAQATISELGQLTQASFQARSIVERLSQQYKHPRKLVPA